MKEERYVGYVDQITRKGRLISLASQPFPGLILRRPPCGRWSRRRRPARAAVGSNADSAPPPSSLACSPSRCPSTPLASTRRPSPRRPLSRAAPACPLSCTRRIIAPRSDFRCSEGPRIRHRLASRPRETFASGPLTSTEPLSRRRGLASHRRL